MLRKFTLPATLALMAASGPVQAAEHLILIMGDGYFPMISYVQDGDTLRFVNSAETTQRVTAQDDAWSTGELEQGAEYILAASAGMSRNFHHAGDSSTTGEISFDPAPVE